MSLFLSQANRFRGEGTGGAAECASRLSSSAANLSEAAASLSFELFLSLFIEGKVILQPAVSFSPINRVSLSWGPGLSVKLTEPACHPCSFLCDTEASVICRRLHCGPAGGTLNPQYPWQLTKVCFVVFLIICPVSTVEREEASGSFFTVPPICSPGVEDSTCLYEFL